MRRLHTPVQPARSERWLGKAVTGHVLSSSPLGFSCKRRQQPSSRYHIIQRHSAYKHEKQPASPLSQPAMSIVPIRTERTRASISRPCSTHAAHPIRALVSQALAMTLLITLTCANSCSHAGARARSIAPSSSTGSTPPPRFFSTDPSKSDSDETPKASSMSDSDTGHANDVLPENLHGQPNTHVS